MTIALLPPAEDAAPINHALLAEAKADLSAAYTPKAVLKIAHRLGKHSRDTMPLGAQPDDTWLGDSGWWRVVRFTEDLHTHIGRHDIVVEHLRAWVKEGGPLEYHINAHCMYAMALCKNKSSLPDPKEKASVDKSRSRTALAHMARLLERFPDMHTDEKVMATYAYCLYSTGEVEKALGKLQSGFGELFRGGNLVHAIYAEIMFTFNRSHEVALHLHALQHERQSALPRNLQTYLERADSENAAKQDRKQKPAASAHDEVVTRKPKAKQQHRKTALDQRYRARKQVYRNEC